MNTSIFQVAGPIMIGPSSSHTAGAAKIEINDSDLTGYAALAVYGAGSVVSKDVPDWAIVAGNPAVVKKFRREI